MQLFTIEFDQLTLSGSEEIRVRKKIHDLPLQTARTYEGLMKDLNFVICGQPAALEDDRKSKRNWSFGRVDRGMKAGPIKVVTSAKKPGKSALQKAAETGDMKDVINALGGK